MSSETQSSGHDHLVRGVALGARVRALAVRSTRVGQELIRRHQALPTAAAAVTRVATACLLLGGLRKGREQVSVQIKCDGPLSELLAIGDAHGRVRASVEQPFIHLPMNEEGRLDVGAAVGSGHLIISRNLGLKEPYHGITPLVSGEIAQDLAHHFLHSEQTPAAMGLSEWFNEAGEMEAAGGFLIQALPRQGLDEEQAEGLDEGLAELEARIEALPALSSLLRDGVGPEALLRQLLPDLEVVGRQPVSFHCTCSRERYEQLMISLGVGELESMIEEQGGAELRCHFCNERYDFAAADLERLISEVRGRS